ncbi:hypothetical protein [Nostoc sp.]|uniref:hypothetical protein n=1 Tax=Nostoc sp. TaxID=1180 RepID=UPI002FF45BE0
MKTDTIFYTLFQTIPGVLFELLEPIRLGFCGVDVGWVERSATQLIIRMLGYAKPPPNLQFFAIPENTIYFVEVQFL